MTTATPTKPTNLPARQNAGPPSVESIQTLDALASECRDIAFSQAGQFARAMAIADGIQRLRKALIPQMDMVMALQGSGLGFKTDKDDKGGYPVEVVRDCLIEATLRGAYPVNNEFNIISARPYMALNFYRRALRELPGVTNIKLHPGVPVAKDGNALVPYKITLRFNGEERIFEKTKYKLQNGEEVDERIPVRVNSGMGVDAILGKAERKMRAYVYAELTGSEQAPEGEVDESGRLIESSPRTSLPVGRTSLANGRNRLTDKEPLPEAAQSEAPISGQEPAGQDSAEETASRTQADEAETKAEAPPASVSVEAQFLARIEHAENTDVLDVMRPEISRAAMDGKLDVDAKERVLEARTVKYQQLLPATVPMGGNKPKRPTTA